MRESAASRDPVVAVAPGLLPLSCRRAAFCVTWDYFFCLFSPSVQCLAQKCKRICGNENPHLFLKKSYVFIIRSGLKSFYFYIY